MRWLNIVKWLRWKLGRVIVRAHELRKYIEEVDRQLAITVADMAEMKDWIDQAVLRLDSRVNHHKGNIEDGLEGLARQLREARQNVQLVEKRLDRKLELEDASLQETIERKLNDLDHRIADLERDLSARIRELEERTSS